MDRRRESLLNDIILSRALVFQTVLKIIGRGASRQITKNSEVAFLVPYQKVQKCYGCRTICVVESSTEDFVPLGMQRWKRGD